MLPILLAQKLCKIVWPEMFGPSLKEQCRLAAVRALVLDYIEITGAEEALLIKDLAEFWPEAVEWTHAPR